ncbi:hypothetical protein Rumeso_02543 [Rubellimicrobium mesophilum DSM 19309]|uniref:Uncharacterized protein n=1 Tax=Rubellimicrobium mesophilum DSM 19309 TaxID=442562 RepID=A0A017HNN2_9RHOB|nr:hypothetical protein Rumeso_02543 [Rubellimicrobium mesophilum DSM 19309]
MFFGVLGGHGGLPRDRVIRTDSVVRRLRESTSALSDSQPESL